MSRPLTRVCVTCRQRRPLGEFRQYNLLPTRYAAECHTCRPLTPEAPRHTKRCAKCGLGKYRREFTVDAAKRDGLCAICRSCAREYAHKKRKRPARECVDCHEYSVLRRCEPCRVKHQAQVMFEAPPQQPGPGMCGIPTRGGWCHEALAFSVDRAGLTTTYCVVHGERVARVIRPSDAGHPRHKEVAA